jgi:hypothetical protein
MPRWLGVAALAAVLSATAPAAAGESASCPLAGQSAMTEAELFFGLAIKGRGPVTAPEWRDFAADTLTRIFPLGFTVTDGSGQWMDSERHRIVRERAKVVVVVADSAGLADKLSAVARVYKKRFRQQSVGIVTRPVCAAF